jgi:hypothetical protein
MPIFISVANGAPARTSCDTCRSWPSPPRAGFGLRGVRKPPFSDGTIEPEVGLTGPFLTGHCGPLAVRHLHLARLHRHRNLEVVNRARHPAI